MSASKKERRIHVYFDSGSKKRRNGASFSFLSLFLFFLFVFVCFFLFLLSAFSRFILIVLVYPHFFHPPFTILIFPSASAIRRYPVNILQTPFNDSQNSRAAEPLCNERNTQPYEI